MPSEQTCYLIMNMHHARIVPALPQPGQPLDNEIVIIAPCRHLRSRLLGGSEPGTALQERNRAVAVSDSGSFGADDREYLARIVAVLDASSVSEKIGALKIFATPEALAFWHVLAPKRWQRLVQAEFERNYVRLPSRNLIERLRGEGA